MSAHEQVGFACPVCGDRMDTKDSRATTYREDKTVRRRRHCGRCDYRVTTYEIIDRGQRDAEMKISMMVYSARQAISALERLIALHDGGTDPHESTALDTANGVTQ